MALVYKTPIRVQAIQVYSLISSMFDAILALYPSGTVPFEYWAYLNEKNYIISFQYLIVDALPLSAVHWFFFSEGILHTDKKE